MTKYDVIYEEIQSRLEQGAISLEQADELNALAYNKYSDIEVSEAEVADYIDHEMGKPYVSGGYSNNVGAAQIDSEMDPGKDWDLETDYFDDELGEPYSTDGYPNDFGAAQIGSEMDPDSKWDLETDYLDDEMGQSISEAADEIQSILDEMDLNDTINRVYEAYEDGVISRRDANTYLSYLDINNYE